jgi:DNA-binding transcriptional ArsR family regulator
MNARATVDALSSMGAANTPSLTDPHLHCVAGDVQGLSNRAGLTPGPVSLDLPLVMAYRSPALLALGDPTRLAILDRLTDRPRAVIDLSRELPVSRPAVSQHLRVLKDAGLVTDQAVGNRRIYRVDPEGLATLRDQLDEFWTKALATYKTIVDQPSQEEG